MIGGNAPPNPEQKEGPTPLYPKGACSLRISLCNTAKSSAEQSAVASNSELFLLAVLLREVITVLDHLPRLS